MDLSRLNTAQREAVTLPISYQQVAKILMVAGAGTGKTTALAHRIAYLVEQGVPGSAIVAITFTTKAAQEMHERVSSMVPAGSRIKMSTFHSLALDIMKAFMPGTFIILDDHDQQKMLKRIVTELKQDAQAGAIFADFKMKDYVKWLSYVRSHCMDPLKPAPGQREADSSLVRAYRRLTAMYVAQKGAEFYDFDDLIEKAVDLLSKNRAAQQSLHDRWKYVLVDEYQDTNTRQFEFVSLITGPETQLLEVGDEDQLIYSWRGAKIENILASYEQSKTDPKTTCIMLTDNYRCTKQILNVANKIVSVNQVRTGKVLNAKKDGGDPVNIKLFASDFEEADFIASQILRWRADGFKFDDVAILLRTNAMAMPIERALVQKKIPYKIYNGASLFDRIEIRLIMNMLLMTANPDKTLYFAQVADELKLGAGPATLQRWDLERTIAKQSWPEFLSAQDFKKGRCSAVLFEEVLRAWQKSSSLSEDGFLSPAVHVWLREFPFLQVFKEDERERRAESLMIFLHLIDAYESDCALKNVKPSIAGFQEQRLLNDSLVDPAGDGKVHVMTLHKSKGLEFPVGFIPGIQDGLFPKSSDGPEFSEEDVRLAYVGITRFKQKLFLTRAAQRTRMNDISMESSIIDPHVPFLTKSGDIAYNRG